ncbi:PREDICTED: sigma factor binding protein 1, chloroplastic-like [Tarenaya hassleriana]|uniref:sigma factor binding protein 1, chloroplastic-like n=1 Tax=Tarenaya hassleriana TaxID=28532 RepID=UPI00053C1C70|nr:PREDICTED: sigma factor binding protein 1, chloroplastic-like [Tarenaya hassleriana]
METTVFSTLQQRKSSTTKKPAKTAKKKTKPIKVRYISNPMKVETCASKFRELVQELTGQDAVDLPTEPLILPAEDYSPVPGSAETETPAAEAEDDQEPYDGADLVPDYFEALDGDMFVPHMPESFSGCLQTGFYNVNAFGSIDSV